MLVSQTFDMNFLTAWCVEFLEETNSYTQSVIKTCNASLTNNAIIFFCKSSAYDKENETFIRPSD